VGVQADCDSGSIRTPCVGRQGRFDKPLFYCAFTLEGRMTTTGPYQATALNTSYGTTTILLNCVPPSYEALVALGYVGSTTIDLNVTVMYFARTAEAGGVELPFDGAPGDGVLHLSGLPAPPPPLPPPAPPTPPPSPAPPTNVRVGSPLPYNSENKFYVHSAGSTQSVIRSEGDYAYFVCGYCTANGDSSYTYISNYNGLGSWDANMRSGDKACRFAFGMEAAAIDVPRNYGGPNHYGGYKGWNDCDDSESGDYTAGPHGGNSETPCEVTCSHPPGTTCDNCGSA